MNDTDYLTEAVKKTLSDMAFLDAEPVEDDEGITGTSHIIAISYEAPERGSIALMLPLACKRQIVENIYGDEWESLDSEEIDDCLLEMLNVLAGEYLSSRYGREVRRDLSLPRLVFDAAELETSNTAERICFDAEGTPFVLIHDRNG